MGSPDLDLVSRVRADLAELADPDSAHRIQSYLKSAMPSRGVSRPNCRVVVREAMAGRQFADRSSWEATVRALWDEATFREERYCAIDLTGVRQAGDWQDPGTLPLYEHLIVTGAWWDLVDDVAVNRLGPLLRRFPSELSAALYTWARNGDRWMRRSAILAQVKAKQDTHVDLLAACIEPNLEDGDFFVRKSIGWALREYSKIDPDWVRWFVSLHEERFSTLSRREALRRLQAAERS